MKTVMKSYFGSKLYGTDTPESDLDIKGIFLPSAKEIIMGSHKEHYSNNTNNSTSKNTSDDVDEEMYSLKYFLELAFKGETIAIDMIHTPLDQMVYTSYQYGYIWEFIQDNRHKFYTTDMKAYLGYVRKQAAKYGVKGTRVACLRNVMDVVMNLKEMLTKEDTGTSEYHFKLSEYVKQLPLNEFAFMDTDDKGNVYYNVLGRKYQTTMRVSEFKKKLTALWDEYGERARKAEANEGIDWKALHHALRGGFQLLEIYQTGDLLYPLKNKDLLLDIKKGNIKFSVVSELLEEVVNDVESASKLASKNGMPDKVDKEFWNDFLLKEYHKVIKQDDTLRGL